MPITTRDNIIAECPDSFAERLSDYIDEVEEQVNYAQNQLVEPRTLEEGTQMIMDANEILDELAKDLY